MRPRDRAVGCRLEGRVVSFSRNRRLLPGIVDRRMRVCLVQQLLESIRRVQYITVIRNQNLSARRVNPNDPLFDPIRAAVLQTRWRNLEEAFWLVFLFTHFGKHVKTGWSYIRAIYGRLGQQELWSWKQASKDPLSFRLWLDDNLSKIKAVPGGFGNHRKYQSLDPWKKNGTGAAVETYVQWVGPPRSHSELLLSHYEKADLDSKKAFGLLYDSMHAVSSFGRTARFDYLTMVGKLGLAPIEPGSAYIEGSTGPRKGALLLFCGDDNSNVSVKSLDRWLQELNKELLVGMQVIEDALCNWQKSPMRFKPFRG